MCNRILIWLAWREPRCIAASVYNGGRSLAGAGLSQVTTGQTVVKTPEAQFSIGTRRPVANGIGRLNLSRSGPRLAAWAKGDTSAGSARGSRGAPRRAPPSYTG